jgi:hypothetical protein
MPIQRAGIMTTGFLVVAAMASMGEFSGVNGQTLYTSNFTTDELAYATAVGCRVATVLDTTILSSLGTSASKWAGITYADNVGKLFAAPLNANAVLIIDPVANTTNITTLVGVGG